MQDAIWENVGWDDAGRGGKIIWVMTKASQSVMEALTVEGRGLGFAVAGGSSG